MDTDSLFLCLNFEGNKIPDKIQLLPAGEYVAGRDGRRWTKRSAEAIAQKSNEYLPQHIIDENHATDLKAPRGESAPAMGWFTNVRAEEDGSVWADAVWTSRGKTALENQEYRYISPVFECDASGEIIKIMRAALTNSPNLELQNLNSTQTAPADNPAKENVMKKEICAALGLPETATDNEVLAAITALKTQANSAQTVDLAAYAPRADLAQMEARAVQAEKTLAEMNAAQLKAKATAAVEKAVADRKIAPASKDAYLAMCATEEGLSNFTKIMESSPALIPGGASGASGTPPAAETQAELNAEEESFCKAMGYTKEEWLKIKGGK
ncbi:hypothetical protein HRI97_05350 [Treponema socranskii subsp. buccale]|uniref:phage protease n=1 Tax=Treponema socranskii TaxID=53419 RepID=UPI0020A5F012|nr:phage protease [Treponema socranskii]UTD02526.1 hypothetical protein HRI97_05350 [Treponema socranskii subsp. buccale]